MRRRLPVLLGLLVLCAAGLTASPVRAGPPAPPGPGGGLEVYRAVVPTEIAARLQQQFDHDFQQVRTLEDGRVEVAVIASPVTARKLSAQGVDAELVRDSQGRTVTQAAAAKNRSGYEVYRTYSGPGGIQQEVQALHARYPRHTQLVVVGESLRGTPILALRVTEDAKKVKQGTRPASLYLGTQHAREWISPEVVRRLMHHFVTGYGSDSELTQLISANEYWFLPVANPDGYDWTFTDGNRLWRKNLRDNNGDGQITADADGVDLNRNFPTHWGYDNEGSSTDVSSQVCRGVSPASEPETRVLDALMGRIGFSYVVNYHSAAELILYGVGWQVNTHTPDDLVYEALAGDDAHPAVPGFDPDLSAELYTTNGNTTDHAHEAHGSLAFTPELTECQSVATDASTCQSVFNCPDDEGLVQAEFSKNIPFALDIARSTSDPANPSSHLGNVAPDFATDPFAVSHGTPQPVAVWAARELGDVTLHYSVDGGPEQTAPTAEWQGGERYGSSNDVHYREVRGEVPVGASGQEVTVWFSGSGKTSDPFTYRIASDTGNPVLVLAAEDYSGISALPAYASSTAPNYAESYVAAAAAAGYAADVYDVDANGRTAPHHLGVLSHYDGVVWYSGNNVTTRDVNHPSPSAYVGKLAADIEVAVRDYLNEGGKAVVTGQHFSIEHALGLGYNPSGEPPYCPVGDVEECIPLSDDFLQYYLGAYKHNWAAGNEQLQGTSSPFDGMAFGLNGSDSAGNQVRPSSMLTTSSFLPADEFPQFASGATMEYVRDGGAPYEPHSGETFVFSQTADVAYKRLTRTIDVPAGGGELSFWMSADTEEHWDFLVVEAHTVGQDDWTTLPDVNGATTRDTGDSCTSGWKSLHPQVEHYQTQNADGTCTATGTTGEWHSFSGNSGGWHEWLSDLSRYAGTQVEVSISYVTDWGTQGLGVFVDDATVLDEATHDFESGLGAWTVPGAPEGSAPNPNDWVASGTVFEEGAAVSTADTHFFGFGLEGVSGPTERAALLGRALDDLLG